MTHLCCPAGASITLDEFQGWNWAFAAVYLFIGIPIYGWAFTEIAAFSTRRINRMMTRDLLYSSITEVRCMQFLTSVAPFSEAYFFAS
jgi:hypothetical protein